MVHNKITRNFAKLLLTLLIVAFVFWGFGNAFRSKDENYAIKIGNIEYSFHQWNQMLSNNIKDATREHGRELNAEEIYELKKYVLNQIVDSTLLYIKARDWGIEVSDDMVRKEILKIPAFFDGGKFSKNLFDLTIKSYGLSEEGFIAKIKEELIRDIFVGSLSGNKLVLTQLTQVVLQDFLGTYEFERIRIPFDAFKIPSTASKEDLLSIYEKNKDQFKIPEERDITYVDISMNKIKDSVEKIYEEQTREEGLRKLYQQKAFLFTEPEKRVVEQIQFSSLDIAKKAREELIKGVDVKTIAKKYAPEFKNIDLGEITAQDFDGDISVQLFKLNKGGISNIIETPLGLYIFKVSDIISAKTKTYEEVEHIIKREYKRELIQNQFLSVVKDVQDAVNNGQSVEKIAKTYNLEIRQIKLRFLSEQENQTDYAQYAKYAFKAPLNAAAVIKTGSDKFSILRVDKITESKIQDFETIQNQLQQMWTKEEVAKKANELVFVANQGYDTEQNKELVDFKKVDISIVKVAIAHMENLSYAVKNESEAKYIAFSEEMKKLVQDEFTKPHIYNLKREVLFWRHKKIIPASQTEIDKHKTRLEPRIQQIEQEAIITELSQHLRKKYGVKINQKVMD
ncbi:SurA N-terminal domain-containing protein [Candidatus Bandiella euplotis]|uniref:Parvulin-like PPIase n=1 Tax=Candidatus Bandiella euplotis TaxID=1664265 RepID=A0ABZ0UQC6_9RICK|nr:SurA N-terminal domain-containing protein [Candidatus Bandiella woodruffii]WPX96215.1 Peptidyl-prolyl cis-trans isomerase [Candidatus Bandiella woodruffii]